MQICKPADAAAQSGPPRISLDDDRALLKLSGCGASERRDRTMPKLCVIALLATVLAPLPSALAAGRADPALETLRQQHFCEILGYLTAIRSRPLALKDRYLVVDVPKTPGYVQCIFFDNDRKALCEVASGFYDQPDIQYVAPDRLAAVAQLGFSLDASKGNYRQERTIKGAASVAKVADLIIRAMHGAYGATPDREFRYEAPLVKEPPPASTYAGRRCVGPTS
jgi:hypothetical protein